MKKLQSVENALIGINDVVFQELCDSFLALHDKNYKAFSRTGSQSGKQKSIKGIPDAFKLLPSGKYVFIEHTTNISNKSKLENDIKNCLDFKKTKIPLNKICEIILCANFNLSAQEVDRLNELLKGKKISLRLYSLDELSIELFYNHRDLLNQYLGLPLDTGQIVSISKFIKEYNKAANSVATPLDNEFVHRENELKQLYHSINSSNFVIITGSPGVGKTKLALEGINSFLSANQNYNAYCVSFKSAPLLDDLYQHLDENLDYILFVDDANRIDSFNQITGFFKNSRKGKLKIVITVRDYALNDIATKCIDFNSDELHLNKFTDEEIIDIIKSESFKIYNPEYHKEIVRIADGNPRLAIMAAKLAIREQNLYALTDVSELFEKYFARFVTDNTDLTKPVLLKSLGLVAFFYTIPYKDKIRCATLLSKFDLAYNDFAESIDILNRLELVELQFEYVKISEQNLSTYFFYKSFIKDEILSFRVLLENFYDSNLERFKDTIIPANNTFGYQNVMEKVKPILLTYWQRVKIIEEKAFNLLNTFWFYLVEETIEFIYNHINKIPEPVVTEYSTEYETNEFSYNHNKIIELLGNFFNTPTKLKDALELAYEYARKRPETFPEIIHTIRNHLLFDSDDQWMQYKRQEIFINLLLEKCNNSEGIYEISFPAIAVSFLQFKYQHTKVGRNNSFHLYYFPFPANNLTKSLREKIWDKIDKDFDKNVEAYTQLLYKYSQPTVDVVKEVMQFDVQYILKIIKNHLKSSNFEHCHYVQEQIRRFIKCGIQNIEFDILKSKYINEVYLMYLKIDWERLGDKNSYEFNDYDEYERLKESQVRESFIFDSVKSFTDFYTHYKYLLTWEKNEYNIKNSFDLIMDENFKIDFDLGIEMLKHIINHNNDIKYIPRLPFKKLLNDQYNSKLIWSIISSRNYNLSVNWKLQYFYFLNERLVNDNYCQYLIMSVKHINSNISIEFSDLIKYLKYDKNLFSTILRVIVEKQKKTKLVIRLPRNFINKYFEYLKNDFNTVKEAYFQQIVYIPNYDYGGQELLCILQNDKNFLMEYIVYLYKQKDQLRSSEYNSLSVVWLIDNIQDVLFSVFDFIAEKEIYLGILDHFCNSFFLGIKKDENKIKSNLFLTSYIDKNYKDIIKMNMIVDVLRNSKKEFFEDAYLHFLQLTQDVNLYSQIWWVENGGLTTGNESLGERLALNWRRVLEFTNKLDLGIKLIPIKKYIDDKIESALISIEEEKRSRFLDRFY